MKSTFTRTIGLVLLLLAALSCTKENLDRCPTTPLRLYFTFQEEDASRGAGEAPRRLDVYLFDTGEKFVGCWSDENATLEAGYYMELQDVPGGQYRVVAWATAGDRYVTGEFLAGASSFAEAEMSLARSAGDTLRDTPLSPLLFGQHPGAIVEVGRKSQYEITLENDVYTLNFKIEGAARNESDYRVAVMDDNTRYRFDNSFLPAPPFHYIATARFDNDNVLKTSMNVLRLANGRAPRLTLRQGPDDIFSGDLVALILRANEQGAGIDFGATRTFDITFRVDVDASVNISINGWDVATEEMPVS